MKFCKFQNLNSLIREISFPELPKYSWNLKMLSIIEKFQNWKFFWKIIEKVIRLLAVVVEKLERFWCHTYATLARLLARWHVKMRSWHAFGMLTRGHVDHGGTHGTYATWFIKLPYALWKCKCDHENYN